MEILNMVLEALERGPDGFSFVLTGCDYVNDEVITNSLDII
jgi:hypothetical protein